VAISGNCILACGPADTLTGVIGPTTEIHDMTGCLVIPGFQDAHLHPLIGSIDFLECSLHDLHSRAEYLARISEYALSHPELAFIRGGGWQYGMFPAEGPTKEELDRLVPDRPVFLKAFDGHSAWVNSAGLARGEITAGTVSPEGGVIVKAEGTGTPTGFLREWPAMGLVNNRLPKPGLNEYLAAAPAFLQRAATYGITGILEAQGKDPFPLVYRELERRGLLSLRVTACRLADYRLPLDQIEEMKRMRAEFQTGLFRYGPAKIFIDGVLEGRTAFLLEPYEGETDFRGAPYWEAGAFREMVAALAREGFPIHTHAVGDAAVRFVLDAIEATQEAAGALPGPHQIAHADLIAPDDIKRMARLGVMANLQPAWFYRDANYDSITVPALGTKRAEGLYPLKDFFAAGVSLGFSSDWPFGGDFITFNPLESIQVAATRQGILTRGTASADPYGPEQILPTTRLIDFHTLGSARACFRADITGTLEPGKQADIAVLDRNILAFPASEISSARVLTTICAGRIIWNARSR
jgi:hypothetical protein